MSDRTGHTTKKTPPMITRQLRLVLTAVSLATLLLAGCANSATYRRAADGAEATCYRETARGTGIYLPGIVGAAWYTLIDGPLIAAESIRAGNSYARCKSELEAAGYSRVKSDPAR